MSNYLFVETRDPFEFADVGQLYDLAGELSGGGHDVTVFLVQNAVLGARSGAKANALQSLAGGGKVTVLADDYSLGERGITPDGLSAGVTVSTMDTLVDLMLEDAPKVVWH